MSLRRFLASSKASRSWAIPESVALSSFKAASQDFAKSLARVVFPQLCDTLGPSPGSASRLPHPGGPQNIALSEDSRLVSTFRSKESAAVRWFWPTKSSRVCGLSLSARGTCDRVSAVVFPRFGLGVLMEAFRLSGVGVWRSSTFLGPLISNIEAICVPLACATTKAALHPESRCLFMFFSRTRPLQTGLLSCKNKDDY